MALKVLDGIVDQLGPATPLGPEGASTGAQWAFVRFNRARRGPVTLEQVIADHALSARLTDRQAGRFAFYSHDNRFVLCGFAGPAGLEIATPASDPAALAADLVRLPAKRKIFWGVALIPTLVGLFFAFDMIKAGRATLRDNPAPRRPDARRLRRALKGQLYWPF